jgi:hypothetical protein
MLNASSQPVFRYNKQYNYAHMVTSVKYDNHLVIAFQAAPAAPAAADGKVTAPVEGLQQQTILWMYSAVEHMGYGGPII